MNRILGSVMFVLMLLILVISACNPTSSTYTTMTSTTSTRPTSTTPVASSTITTPEKQISKPTGDEPKYGGMFTFPTNSDVTTWDPIRIINSMLMNLTNEQTFEGDWSKGPAGGYGTNQTDWGLANNDIFDLKTGYLAESVKWSIDAAKTEGTLIYQVRQGVHFGLNPNSEASRLVNGREMTADDIVYSFKRACTYNLGYLYMNNPELRTANITKTGPWEVTVKVPYSAMIIAISRFNDTVLIVPHEVVEKYGSMDAWQRIVGTGPFMFNDYVAGSQGMLVRNPNYWMKDPVGPGKGNQLPYLDTVRMLIIPDSSTRIAALRTGKTDYSGRITGGAGDLLYEDAASLNKTAPELKEKVEISYQGRGNECLNMRIDTVPFKDIRVRRAMCMCVDYNSILKNYFHGQGQIYTFPHSYIKDYQELYLPFSDYPDSAKELYSYNPEKAKELLKEAGYPNGFKTSIILTQTEVDFISIYKDYLSKIGIDMTLDVKEPSAKTTIQNNRSHTQMITGDTAPISIFYNGQPISGTAHNNRSYVDDPYINQTLIKVREVALTDIHEAMKIYKEMTKYVVDQAYAVPAVTGNYYIFWWPWVKNYSGESVIGYDDYCMPQYIWYDQALKKSMGH